MIQGKLLTYGDDLKEVYSIRRKVFVEEQNIPEEDEFDSTDNEAIHVLIYEQNSVSDTINRIAVATGRIIFDGETCEISHIAVIKEYRNMKYGDLAVRMLINKAFTAGINKVQVNSPLELLDFFKSIGFTFLKDNSENSDNSLYKMVIYINNVNTSCKK